MLLNYLKILFRGFIRNRTFTTINVLGLSVGFTCFLLITLYIVDEFAFESHQEKLDRVYLVSTEASFAGQTQKWTGVPNIAATAIAKEIPEVEKAVRVFPHGFGAMAFVASETVKSSETRLAWVDADVFDVLSYTFLSGDPKTALVRPNTTVICASAARKYFGTTEVIGKTITVDQLPALEITGVYQDPPPTSRFQYPILATFQSNWFGDDKRQSWGNASFETYLLLRPGANPATVEKKIDEMISRTLSKDQKWFTLRVMPLKDVYIYLGDIVDFGSPNGVRGDINQIRILVGLALIVILIASLNYMNLATAQSLKRFKEIGISKTLGATSRQLARQFFSETAVYVLIAMLLSVTISSLSLSWFNAITGKSIGLYFLATPWFWTAFIITWFVLSLFSGSYPAFYLSAFTPKRVLNATPTGAGGTSLRKGLVIVQFSASIVLIISSLVLYRQLNFMRDKKLGYKPEQVVAILTTGAKDRDQVLSLKAALEQLPDVISTSRSQSYPGSSASGRNIHPLDGAGDGKSIKTVRSDYRILETLGVQLLAGTLLPENKTADDTTVQVIINKTAADFLGLSPEECIKRKVKMDLGWAPSEIVGVMDDFHAGSVKEEIGAYSFHNARTESYNFLLVKLKTEELTKTMAAMEETFKKIIPSAFEYTFLEQRLATLYRSEEQLAQIILLFASLAIFVACLGLYALAAYTTERRTREIGIRKTLGASVFQLSNMLSKDFIRLVVISFVIAGPIGYYAMQNWLQSFAYRTDLSPTIFVGAGIVSILIAWATVGFESVKAALMNPVESLRNE